MGGWKGREGAEFRPCQVGKFLSLMQKPFRMRSAWQEELSGDLLAFEIEVPPPELLYGRGGGSARRVWAARALGAAGLTERRAAVSRAMKETFVLERDLLC